MVTARRLGALVFAMGLMSACSGIWGFDPLHLAGDAGPESGPEAGADVRPTDGRMPPESSGDTRAADVKREGSQDSPADSSPPCVPGALRFVIASQPAVDANPDGIAAGDFNSDGTLDLAVVNFSAATVSVLLGKGDGTFHAAVGYPTGPDPAAIITGHFDGDPYLDLAVASSSGGMVSATGSVDVLLGNGDGTFRAAQEYVAGVGPYAIAGADFDGDGAQDLAVANPSTDLVSVLFGNGDGTFGSPSTWAVAGMHPQAILAGALLLDGPTFVVTANSFANDVSALQANTDGTFQAAKTSGAGSYPFWLASADFNGDNRFDLAVASYMGNSVDVLLGNGDGTFATDTTNPVGHSPKAVAAADFDQDGNTDLVSANYDSDDVSVLLGHGVGTFGKERRFGAGSNPTSVVSGYVNGDSRIDIVVANFTRGQLTVLLNEVCPP